MITDYFIQMQLSANEAQSRLLEFVGLVLEDASIEVEIVQLNKNQLYELGEDRNQIRLIPYSSSIYAEMKFNMRGRELTDLYLTGEFQRNFYIITNGEEFQITSSDEKTNELIEKYGEDIFGLSEENYIIAYQIIKLPLGVMINETSGFNFC